MKTYKEYTDVFNYKLLKNIQLDENDMPIILGTLRIPQKLISFNYALSASNKEFTSVHFYIDDYQFERVWHYPEKYLKVLKQFDCVIGPDFSLYKNFPKPLQIYNLYRQRLLTAFWQSKGLTVIPNITWSNEESLNKTLQGIPKHSTVALSTNGCLNKATKEEFIQCFKIAMETLEPYKILIIGEIPSELQDYPNILTYDSRVNYFNEQRRIKHGRKK